MSANKVKKISLLLLVPFLACMSLSFMSFGKAEKDNLSIKTSTEMKLVTGDFVAAATTNDSLYDVLDQIKSGYGYENAQEELILDKIMPTAFGKIYKFIQINKGLTVFGRGLNVSVDKSGKVLSVSGNFLSGINISIQPTLSADDALAVVNEGFEFAAADFAELEIYSLEGITSLAYNIEATLEDGNYRIFIDAKTGAVLDKTPLGSSLTFGGSTVKTTQTDYYGNVQTVNIEKSDSGPYYLADATRNLYMLDNQTLGDSFGNYLQTTNFYTSHDGVFTDTVSINAFKNVIKAFDFYTDSDNIGVSVRGINNSADEVRDNVAANREMMVYTYLHYGKNLENAYYTGSPRTQNYVSLIFGDGRRYGSLYNVSLATDAVGHEYQHASTDYISGLLYRNASGALNEAYSDIFGALIEDLDIYNDKFWTIAEDATPSKLGLRSMKDPKSYGFPAHNSEKIPFSNNPSNENDQGGVHTNNTILTHVQYKMWKAMPEHFTKENIGTLWYSALGMLSSNATFEDFRMVLCQAAVQLGWDSSVLNVMHESFLSSDIDLYHTVTFKSEGTVLSVQSVLDGRAAIPPSTPVKASTEQYAYTFTGWDVAFDCVTGALTVNAVFSANLRKYTVTWVIEDEIETQQYFYGDTPVYSGEPSKASDGRYSYSFIGWDNEIEDVIRNTTYTAQFSSVSRAYTITFISDGQQIEQAAIVYGEKITDFPEPVKEGYTFEGWYVDQACKVAFKASGLIYSDLSLYAKWAEDNKNSTPPSKCNTITTDDPFIFLFLFTCLAGLVVCKRKADKTQTGQKTRL